MTVTAKPRAAGAGGDRLPEERREEADDEADQARDGDRVARAPRRCLRRRAAVDDAGKLDLLGQREQLLGLQPVLLESAPPLLGRQEQGGQGQALGPGCALELGLRLVDGAVDRLELPVVRRELLLEGLLLEPRVAADLVDDALRDRRRRRAHLASPVSLDRDGVELVGRRLALPPLLIARVETPARSSRGDMPLSL